MVFPNRHLYITAHWTVSGVTSEEGQFGLRASQTSLPTEAEGELISQAIQGFWGLAANGVSPSFVLDEVKLALIDPDGRYPEDFEPMVLPIVPGIPGGATGGSRFPLQTACVASLTTAFVRGRAHRGRIYLPPIQADLTASFQWTGTPWTQRAAGVALMIEMINAQLTGNVAVFSKVGAGTSRQVTGVAVGSRPDTQRRRARQQPETYTTADIDP